MSAATPPHSVEQTKIKAGAGSGGRVGGRTGGSVGTCRAGG